MTVRSPFAAHFGTTQIVTASASSATIAISNTNKSVRIYNAGTGIFNFRTYKTSDGTQTASAADCFVAPGSTQIFEKPQDHDTLAYFSTAGAAAVNIMTGEGGI